MNETLPLHPLHTLLPLDRPFTRPMARAVGVERASLDRMLREGTVRRILRGGYAASTAPDTAGLRAAALTLVISREAIAVDRTAAWVHGVDVVALAAGETRPVEIVSPGRGSRRARSGRGALGSSRQLAGHDVQRIDGLRLTTPLRTALDLGRLLPPERALGAMDQLLAGGRFTHAELLAEIPRLAAQRGVGQLRTLAVQVDARSSGLAESALRLRWHQARLPTATPGMPVCASGRVVRLSLGVERRQFGAVLAGQVSAAELVALEGAGWRIVVLSEERVLRTDAEIWMRHLEREFHQHLLAQVDDEAG
ncbi:MAG: hypothetical protein JWR85_2588 [Marmoricola sp.]|nr:hypothetical protein [Marmoricola sp.]